MNADSFVDNPLQLQDEHHSPPLDPDHAVEMDPVHSSDDRASIARGSFLSQHQHASVNGVAEPSELYELATATISKFLHRKAHIVSLFSILKNIIIVASYMLVGRSFDYTSNLGFIVCVLVYVLEALCGCGTYTLRCFLCICCNVSPPTCRFVLCYGSIVMMSLLDTSAVFTFFFNTVNSWNIALSECEEHFGTRTSYSATTIPADTIINIAFALFTALSQLAFSYGAVRLSFTSFDSATCDQIAQYLYDNHNIGLVPSLFGLNYFVQVFNRKLPFDQRILTRSSSFVLRL